MTTEKQKKANRRNSKKSTGPRTKQGKAKVAKNALKHGILTHDALLDCEDKKSYEDLLNNMRKHFQPVGEMEVLLVEKLVNTLWRVKRLTTVEAGLFSRMYFRLMMYQYQEAAEMKPRVSQMMNGGISGSSGSQELFEDKIRIKFLADAAIAEKKSESFECVFGRAFDIQGDHLMKLSRYEAGLERVLKNTMDELQKVQLERMKAIPTNASPGT